MTYYHSISNNNKKIKVDRVALVYDHSCLQTPNSSSYGTHALSKFVGPRVRHHEVKSHVAGGTVRTVGDVASG